MQNPEQSTSKSNPAAFYLKNYTSRLNAIYSRNTKVAQNMKNINEINHNRMKRKRGI